MREYLVLALCAGLLVGISAPLVGTFVVHRRMSLIGDGLGHVAFLGVALGIVFGVAPLWVGLVFAVIGAVSVDWVQSKLRTAGDVALAIVFYAGLAGGVVVASSSGQMNAALFSYLFGSLLTVTWGDVATMAVLAAVVLATVVLTRRSLFVLVLAEDLARTSGLPVAALNRIVLLTVALVVGIGMRVVGVLLIAALIVLPVAVAQIVARSFVACLTISSAVGAAAVALGLGASVVFDLAPGGTIVLCAIGAFVVVQALHRIPIRHAGGPASPSAATGERSP